MVLSTVSVVLMSIAILKLFSLVKKLNAQARYKRVQLDKKVTCLHLISLALYVGASLINFCIFVFLIGNFNDLVSICNIMIVIFQMLSNIFVLYICYKLTDKAFLIEMR